MRWLLDPMFPKHKQVPCRALFLLYVGWMILGFRIDMSLVPFWLGCILLVVGDFVIFVQKEEAPEQEEDQ